MATMAEDNARDMKRLRLYREAHEACMRLIRDGVVSVADYDTVKKTADVLQKRAEHIEAVWN